MLIIFSVVDLSLSIYAKIIKYDNLSWMFMGLVFAIVVGENKNVNSSFE